MTEIRSDTRPIQINQKDANQDQEIALLKHRIEDTEEMASELRDRVRKLEKWVWGAAAVISAGIALVGLISAADAKMFDDEKTFAIMAQKIRQWEIDENKTKPNDIIDNALKEWNQWEQ